MESRARFARRREWVSSVVRGASGRALVSAAFEEAAGAGEVGVSLPAGLDVGVGGAVVVVVVPGCEV